MFPAPLFPGAGVLIRLRAGAIDSFLDRFTDPVINPGTGDFRSHGGHQIAECGQR